MSIPKKKPVLSQKVKEAIENRVESGQLYEEIFWTLQMLSIVKTEHMIDESVRQAAISPGCIPMLQYALVNRKAFMEIQLPKAHSKLAKDRKLDGDVDRDNLERVRKASAHFVEKRKAQRKCPKCGQDHPDAALLSPGAEGTAAEPGVERVRF